MNREIVTPDELYDEILPILRKYFTFADIKELSSVTLHIEWGKIPTLTTTELANKDTTK